MKFRLKYLIADIECLSDYFSLQVKNESSDEIFIYECFNDEDCNKLYDNLQFITRPMYFYSIDYDKVMLNALCKFVEKKETNILHKLRKVNDYLIKNNLNYFRLNRTFWCDHYFKYKALDDSLKHEELFLRAKALDDSLKHEELFLRAKALDDSLKHEELFLRAKEHFSGNQVEYDFISEFPALLGQSKVIKNAIINSIPKILYYFSIRKDNSIIPTISLKNLQLLKEGYNVKFDFNKYTSIEEIKKDNLYEDWIKYSKNDISSLEKIFLDKPRKDIMKRVYAIEAVLQLQEDFEYTDKMIYSENNTELIVQVLKLPEHQINKDFDINYNDYIKTSYEKFNNFVDFVNSQQNIKKDYEVKQNYINYYNSKIVNDDYNILDVDGNPGLKINSFDIINIKNELNDIDVKIGLGGCHGAIPKYTDVEMEHYDYTSQYPSIILQYKHLFKNVINVDLYEAIYNLRIKSKLKLEQLEKLEKNENTSFEELEKLQNIVEGEKLILNTAFGIINSNFNLPIACKKLGRFICLKGQELILNLCDKLKISRKLINVNTDGVISSKNPSKIIELIPDGYFSIGLKTIDKIVQNDVNNYIAIAGTKIKRKGFFNLSIKQWIAKNEKLAINIENGINLLIDKKVNIKPIYFHHRFFDKNLIDIPWFLTSKKEGRIIVKNVKKPEILSLAGENLYFTSNEDKADFSIYQKYAEIMKHKILEFSANTRENNNKYYECKLIEDDFSLKEKRTIKRNLGKIFGSKNLNFVGFNGKNKSLSYTNNEPVKPLVQYTMTDILKSTFCNGFGIENNKNNEYIIIDVDIFNKKTGTAKKGWEVCKGFLKELKSLNTFECWNHITKKYNRKFIFLSEKDFNFNEIWNKNMKKYHKYIEIINCATVYTFDKKGDIKYDCNWVKPISIQKLNTR